MLQDLQDRVTGTFQLPADRFCSEPAAPSSVAGLELSANRLRYGLTTRGCQRSSAPRGGWLMPGTGPTPSHWNTAPPPGKHVETFLLLVRPASPPPPLHLVPLPLLALFLPTLPLPLPLSFCLVLPFHLFLHLPCHQASPLSSGPASSCPSRGSPAPWLGKKIPAGCPAPGFPEDGTRASPPLGGTTGSLGCTRCSPRSEGEPAKDAKV